MAEASYSFETAIHLTRDCRTVLTEMPSRASLIDHAGALDGLALRRPNSPPKYRIRARCRSGVGARDWCDHRDVQRCRCRLAPPTAIPGAGPSGMGRGLVSEDGARVHVGPRLPGIESAEPR